MNIMRGIGRIFDVLIAGLWGFLTGSVEAAVYVWDGFFGPPDEAPKNEWHRH